MNLSANNHQPNNGTPPAHSEWLEQASWQIGLEDAALEAIDRCIDLRKDDTLLCETTCLDYAVHALASGDGVKGLWLVPPQYTGGSITEEMLSQFETRLRASSEGQLAGLEERGKAFRGLTASIPDGPFKLLVTSRFDSDPGVSALEWPLFNYAWSGMLSTEGAVGAVLYPNTSSVRGKYPSLNMSLSGGACCPEGFVRSLELPGGHVVLALGEPTGSFHMEDLSDAENPWEFDATMLDLAVSNGCLVPSLVRHGARVLRSPTLGELASRISRGTALSERDLDIREPPSFSRDSTHGFGEELYRKWNGEGYAPSVGSHYEYPGDMYYIDGTCFRDGTIRPKVLDSMPEGQGRYIVDSNDGEVLLVSRSSREVAVYKNIRHPTLIGNSVFVIRPGREACVDYLACWMRGSYARALMGRGGRLLSKSVLADLPVPILDDEMMDRTVSYERSIDEDIFDLYQTIAGLKASNRFNPLAAARQRENGAKR